MVTHTTFSDARILCRTTAANQHPPSVAKTKFSDLGSSRILTDPGVLSLLIQGWADGIADPITRSSRETGPSFTGFPRARSSPIARARDGCFTILEIGQPGNLGLENAGLNPFSFPIKRGSRRMGNQEGVGKMKKV